MGLAYYNEIDKYCCQWIENLMHAGHIPLGVIDDRPIQEVKAHDLEPYTACHFFAGLGGWAYALRLAAWDDDEPVWTGSCPCQPFSHIGQKRGFADERHLWPSWFSLICESKPPTIFGEQVENAAVWLDLVFDDLEAQDYACGAAYLPAASIGARHERQRIWFVADADQARWEDPKGFTAAKEKAYVRPASGMVHCETARHLRGSFEPDSGWISDGLSGEGLATAAYGNAIVPQVAAEFIRAYKEILK